MTPGAGRKPVGCNGRTGSALLAAFSLALAGCLATPAPAGMGPPPPVATPTLPAASRVLPTVVPTEAPFTGFLAPDFTLPDIAGRPVTLRTFRGHPVWLNLWATWCTPCQVEMPEMEKLYGQYKSQGLVVLGVDEREDAGHMREFVGRQGFDWQFLLDGDGTVARRYYLTGLPMHVFIDRTGAIRALQPGGIDQPTMVAFLHRIIP